MNFSSILGYVVLIYAFIVLVPILLKYLRIGDRKPDKSTNKVATALAQSWFYPTIVAGSFAWTAWKIITNLDSGHGDNNKLIFWSAVGAFQIVVFFALMREKSEKTKRTKNAKPSK